MDYLLRTVYLLFFTIFFSFIIPSSLHAQYEYLSTLNYNNLVLNQVRNIPGVTYVADKSTYDANGQRFFFFGEPAAGWPEQLFTINAVTGATIYNPVCPPGDAGGANIGHAYGLQYDNATDTLYALYFNLTDRTSSFVWIDPVTGNVHVLAVITNFGGYLESSFDERDHIYIINGAGELIGLNASTGSVVFTWNTGNINNIDFDNLNGKLYAIDYTAAIPEFDSISMNTGLKNPIAALPTMNYDQFGAWAIDEQNEKFILVAGNFTTASCILNSLYVLDLKTGAVLSQSLYPYAQSVASYNAENVIEYSFDNKRGVLYALNWLPPNANNPITIAGPVIPPCRGSQVTFTATIWNGFSNPSYQWQVNGIDEGTDTSVFTSSSLVSGDTVRCIFRGQNGCTINVQDTSNSLVASFVNSVTASVTISVISDTVCSRQQVTFTAHAVNTGSVPAYQWQINNSNTGPDDSVFTTSNLSNGDSVCCVISPNTVCVSPGPDTSNILVMHVDSVDASVSITASANSICAGDTVIFAAMAVNTGKSPVYQWEVNGISTGINSDSLVISSLKNNDLITCILISSFACAIPVHSSDSITMVVSPIPVIIFNPDTLVITPGGTVSLNPETTGDFASYQWLPVTGLSNPLSRDPVAGPPATTVYQLKVLTNAGCTGTGKETVLVYHPLEMPSAFTPNGDGENDLFRIPPSTAQQIKSFAVFNRWGEKIFNTSNSSAGWDGNFKGQPQPPGAYVWMIEYENMLTRQTELAKGTVILIR